MLSLSCVFDVAPDWDCLLSPTVRPHSILRSLIASAFFHGNKSVLERPTVDAILSLYEAVSQFSHINHVDAASISDAVKRVISLAKQDDLLNLPLNSTSPSNTVDRVNLCCQLCSLIFWKLLENRGCVEAGIPTTNMEETELLLETLTKVESQYWIQNAPETLILIVFTGAAACSDEKDRGSFFRIGGRSLAAIDSDSLALVRQGWRYFGLLRRLAGLPSPSELPGGTDS